MLLGARQLLVAQIRDLLEAGITLADLIHAVIGAASASRHPPAHRPFDGRHPPHEPRNEDP